MKLFDLLFEAKEKNFSFDEFLKYVSIGARRRYLEQCEIKFINAGSSREVYLLDRNKVLKLAYNEIGYTQNETEYNLFKSSQNKTALAAVYEPHEKDFAWIVSERVKPIEDKKEFEKYTGITFELAIELMGSICIGNPTKEAIKDYILQQISYWEEIDELHHQTISNFGAKEKKVNPKILELKKALNATENFYSLCRAASELESNVSDLRTEQLGINTKNKLVILDYGFGNSAFAYYNNIYRLADENNRREIFMDDENSEPTEDEYGHPIKRIYQNNTQTIVTPSNNEDDIPF